MTLSIPATSSMKNTRLHAIFCRPQEWFSFSGAISQGLESNAQRPQNNIKSTVFRAWEGMSEEPTMTILPVQSQLVRVHLPESSGLTAWSELCKIHFGTLQDRMWLSAS